MAKARAGKNGKKAEAAAPTGKTVARNRRATFDYEILDRFQAGIALAGGEIKSVRESHVQLQGAYARLRNGEIWLENAYIAPYENQGYTQVDPNRNRKLLLKKKEIVRIAAYLDEKGLTLIPLSMYINARGLAKVELGVARGLKKYDKREKIREREESRQVARVLRHSF